MTLTKRRALTVTGAVGFLLAATAMIAYACTNLASLNLESSTGAAGDTLQVTGSSFGAEPDVTLHWNSVEGAELATVTPDQAGNINATITIPEDAQPGYFVLVATQTGEDGSQVFGGPARAAFQVLGPGGEALETQPAGPDQLAQFAASSDSTSAAGMIALTAALGVLGLGLFGAGIAGFAREARAPRTAKASNE